MNTRIYTEAECVEWAKAEHEKWRQQRREKWSAYKNNYASIDIQKKIRETVGINDELADETTPLQLWIDNTVDRLMEKYTALSQNTISTTMSEICIAVGFSKEFIEKQEDLDDDYMGHCDMEQVFEILIDRILRKEM